MANSIWVDVVKSVTKTSFTSVFMAVGIVRLGMMAYPADGVPGHSQTAHQVEEQAIQTEGLVVEAPSAKTIAKDAPRIVFGQNSIESLKNRN